MMDQESRKESRINTHIAAEINIDGHNCCGYIENLTKEGMGIISLDQFELGQKVTLSFYLIGVTGKISPQATVIHSEKGIYNLYNYGFQFDGLAEKESKAIDQYMNDNNLIQTA
jgi:PilZ domain.